MKVLVRKDARSAYIGRQVHSYHAPVNWKWADMLEKIQGTEIEIETDFLFLDQFNTVPIPGVSETGMRLMLSDVEKIIDDIQPGKGRCGFCGKVVDNPDSACPHCGKSDLITRFYAQNF